MRKAISEINRVLKPGGINFCVVPTTTDRLYAFFTFYLFLLERTFAKLKRKLVPAKPAQGQSGSSAPAKASNPSVYFRHFPFPPPHGSYGHYLKEIRKWTLCSWKKIITANSTIPLLAQYGFEINTLLPLLGNIFPKTWAKAFEGTRRLENKLAGNSFFRLFGISTL